MYAVVRLTQDLGDAWHVLKVTKPIHQSLVQHEAVRIAEEYHLDERLVDAIYNGPRLPFTRMHAFWCVPGKVLDVRPIEAAVALRHYWIEGAEVVHLDEERDIGAYDATRYAPLTPVEVLEPYGTDRFFHPRTTGRGPSS